MLSLNVSSLRDFALTKSVLQASGLPPRLPCVEILWDNFCNLQGEALAEHLRTLAERASFHVMWSRFLEREPRSLDGVLERLAQHVRDVANGSFSGSNLRPRPKQGLDKIICQSMLGACSR